MLIALLAIFVFSVSSLLANDGTACPLADGKTCTGTDLFKGKTIEDFDFFLDDGSKKEEVFSICAEGVLSVKGKPFGWIGTKKLYKNFKMSVEFRYPDKENFINSGIFLRVNGEPTMFLPRCIEVQLAPKSMGDLYTFWDMQLTGSPERSAVNAEHKLTKVLRSVKQFRNTKKDDLTQWHQAEIVCFEDMLLIKINGQIVNWANGVENIPGRIAFQSEGAPIDFKNAMVVELQ